MRGWCHFGLYALDQALSGLQSHVNLEEFAILAVLSEEQRGRLGYEE